MKKMIDSYTAYNVWANRRIITMIKKLSAGDIDKHIPSSFPTIRKTIHHISGAQSIWLSRLNGISPSSWPDTSNDINFDDYDTHLITQSEKFAQYTNQIDDAGLELLCKYTLLNGQSFEQPKWQMIMHCMNHSTYHRGQIITMLRNFEVKELLATDYIFYLREVD